MKTVNARIESEKSNEIKERKNHCPAHAQKLMKSEMARTDARLWEDFQLLSISMPWISSLSLKSNFGFALSVELPRKELLDGQCVYLPHFFCPATDFTYLQRLTKDLEQNSAGMINWSKHFKHENPDFSPTFREIVGMMSTYFDVEVYATRLNFYADGSAWKPFHHDSHAYSSNGMKEDFTMGASFGGSRALVILHEPSANQFSFPQNNGDVFSFTSQVNKQFMHGVPKSNIINIGPRFSIIAWGRRKTLNSRNAGATELKEAKELESRDEDREDNTPKANPLKKSDYSLQAYDREGEEKEVVMTSTEVAEMVSKFIADEEKKRAPITAGAGRGTQTSTPASTSGRGATASSAPAAGRGRASTSRIQGGWSGNARGGRGRGAPTRGAAPQRGGSGGGRGGGWGQLTRSAEIAKEVEDEEEFDDDDA